MVIEKTKIKDVYFQPAFLICSVVLAIAGGLMSVAIAKFGVYLEKKPLPLIKSFDLLDEEALAPYKVISKSKIENEYILSELGTDSYIQWVLEDPCSDPDSTVRRCLLFITYYEQPGRVVHVPDECYMGSGNQRLAMETVTFEIDRAEDKQQLNGRYLLFSGGSERYWRNDLKFPILYIFNVNGSYASGRAEARVILNRNVFSQYSYSSKVEFGPFYNGAGTRTSPTKEEAVAATEKILNVLLPVLESDHWPELEK